MEKVRYDVRSLSQSGIATRLESKADAYELAKAVARQDEFGESVMTQIVWDKDRTIVSYKSLAIKADGTFRCL